MFHSTTTKQINVHGKRSRRVVSVSDENRGAAGIQQPDASPKDILAHRVSRPHIARTSTSPLNTSKFRSISNQPITYKKFKPKPKKADIAGALALDRQPFKDVINSPMAKRTNSDYFPKLHTKPRKPSSEVITLEDSEEETGFRPSRRPIAIGDSDDSESELVIKSPRRRARRIVESDEELDSEDDINYVPPPRAKKNQRRIVSISEEEEVPKASTSDAQDAIDLTAQHSYSPNPPLTSKHPAPRHLNHDSVPYKSSGNLFNQKEASLHIPKKRFPSGGPRLPTSRKASKTQSLLQPFEVLTIEDTPPKKTTQRFMSLGANEDFSPLKTRTQRKASHMHPVKTSPLRDSALSPPRTHRARVFSKHQKESPIRSSLLPVEEEKRKETKIVEVKAAPPKPRPAVSAAVPSRLPPTFRGLLQPLLSECGQKEVMDFDFFVSTFTSDELFDECPPVTFSSKIGEATYSEVFGCGNVVLKIVPLRNPETASREEEVAEEELPTQSEIAEVEREIITTRALGEFSKGFVKLLRAWVVKGRYPKKLLSLWDKFDKQRGSENVRPSCFDNEQYYAIIVLPNGGPDLENYDFKKSKMLVKRPWFKACSIFWQVVSALQRAEDLVGFEHRDLHWGQILVKDRELHEAEREEIEPNLANPRTAGVTVTIIDLGLARMDDMGDDTKQRWTEFDPEIFEGEGDYQYDVYRMMKAHNGGEWGSYHPLTNVMWLHYILLKLLQAKRIRPPAKSRAKASASVSWSESQSYENLVGMEKLLEKTLKTRMCRAEDPLRSAGDIWKLALKKNWVVSNL